MLLVEQHVRQALEVADRVYVMQRGRVALSGSVEDVRGQLSEIEAAYLTAAEHQQLASTCTPETRMKPKNVVRLLAVIAAVVR